MKSILTFTFLCAQAIVFAQNPGKLIHFGGPQNDLSYGLCSGSGTDFFTSGYFSGSVTMGNTMLVSSGSEDIYIAKHDSTGQVLWAKKAGGTGSDMSFSLSYNNGYAYITGVFNGTATFGTTSLTGSGQTDGFMAKYDENGNLIWAKKAGGSSSMDRTDEIAFEGGNILYMCASYVDGATYNGVSLSSNGGVDAYILKLDTAGNLLKYTNMGGSSNDYTYDLKWVDGSLYITGNYFSNTIDFGTITKSKIGNYDSYVAKYDTALNVVWANSGGGSGSDDLDKLVVDSAGNCYVTGYFIDQAVFNGDTINSIVQGARDGCIVKYNPNGSLAWVRKIGAYNGGAGREIKFGNTQNEIVVYGHFGIQLDNNSQNIVSNGSTDGFILKYDQNGNTTSLFAFGGEGAETICETAIVGNKVWVSGGLSGTSLFNAISVTSNGGTDISLWEFVNPITVTTGLNNIYTKDGAIAIYPNPSSGLIQLDANNGIKQIEIFDQLGKLIFSKSANDAIISLELNLPQGIYTIRAKAEHEIMQQKLIIN